MPIGDIARSDEYELDDAPSRYPTASNMSIQPNYPPPAPPADARWLADAVDAQARYRPPAELPDVGAPLIPSGPQISAGSPWANRAADVMGGLLGAKPDQPDPTVMYRTASPLVNITQGDLNRATDLALTFSGGGLATKAVKPLAAMPEVAERYPQTVPPVTAIDPIKQKEFLQKANSPEAEAVSKLRTTAQRDISKGNYTPYFDPAQRYDVNPASYPPIDSTLTQLSTRPGPKNAAAYAAAAGPEAAARLDAAYARGMQQEAGAGNWYHMGQLENEFIKEYGPTEGPKQFKAKFADAMAATTGGADPTSNLMMAHYGNYLQAKGLPLPAKSYDYPFPVGGRFAGSNMEQYRKMLMEGAGVTAANPKRYNFAGNFTGNPRGSTIDEQMMGLIEPGGAMNPPGGAYGHYEQPVAARAAAAGVDPRYFQEVAWAGAKDAKTKGGYAAQPMIGVVNEAIERTHRITGMPKEEIVRRGLVRSEIPLYGVAGATGMGALAASDRYEESGR